jgi:hypothetical protein
MIDILDPEKPRRVENDWAELDALSNLTRQFLQGNSCEDYFTIAHGLIRRE